MKSFIYTDMKKYLEFIKESTYLNAISTETLEAKLEDLQLQMTELQEEMASIRSILEYRKTNSVTEFAKNLPESIFDFNQEQLDFIFEHHQGVNQKQYDLARTFYRELFGVHDYGFNPKTNQTMFTITTTHSFDDDDEDLAESYQENEQQIKSIKFLGENLKRIDTNSRENGEYYGVGDVVKFHVSYYFSTGELDYVLYVSETELYVANLYGRKVRYNSISKMLEALVDDDLSHKDKDTGWEWER
jgi:hypothetical protein